MSKNKGGRPPKYKGVEIFYDCQCVKPKPTKIKRPEYLSTQCECGDWISDYNVVMVKNYG